MARFVSFVALALSLVASTSAFPAHGSLAGLTQRQIDELMPSLKPTNAKLPPPPLAFNGTKLVNDAAHPWMAPKPTDNRGPCPGLNTLASHGWLPHDGVASPHDIVVASMEGFNFDHTIATRFAYSSHLIDGNQVTDLLSIGAKTPLTGKDTPSPSTPDGLNLHGNIEGDGSMTRADAYFGDNHSFNETQFQDLVSFMNKYGAGKYNYTVAGEFRYHRIQQSIANNPQFSFTNNRFEGAYVEIIVAANLFADGRRDDHSFDIPTARSFFQDHRMPDDFHRANKPYGIQGTDIVFGLHPFMPGKNINGVNTYTVDENAATFSNDPDGCATYEWFVKNAVQPLYPNPTGILKANLKLNLHVYWTTFPPTCTELFPYGK